MMRLKCDDFYALFVSWFSICSVCNLYVYSQRLIISGRRVLQQLVSFVV